MKVLLTGATGFIGRHVLSQCLRSGVEVVVVGRRRPIGYTGTFIQADLLQHEGDKEIVQHAQATHLLHLAWYAEHGQYWNSPLNFRWVEASMRLVESFCALGGRKVVVAGTCAEYDWSFGYCLEDTTPLNPETLYGTAKDATRRLLQALCNSYQVQFVWGRIFLPYGEGEDRRRLVPSLMEVFRGKRPPFGVNANAYRDFLHVKDVASGFVRLLAPDAQGVYNIASGQPTRIEEVVRAIAHAYSKDPRIVLDLNSERPGEPEILFGDNRRLRALGWKPTRLVDAIVLGNEFKRRCEKYC